MQYCSTHPGADLFRKSIYIIETQSSTLGMQEAVRKMSALALKLAKAQPIGPAELEGFLARGVRKNYTAANTGAVRAVDMLLRKMGGASYTTEYRMPKLERVTPLPPIAQLSRTTLALISSGDPGE